jgi:hypothetical protein
MVMLIFALFLNAVPPLSAQSTLQLPDVTLFGEYTLYLPAPEPKSLELPTPAGLSDHRLGYPHSTSMVILAPPRPPQSYWQRIPRSAVGPPGLLPAPGSEGSAEPGPEQAGLPPGPSAGWQGGIDYIPGKAVVSAFTGARSSGVWDLSADLRFDLADGWVVNPPNSPTDLLVTAQAVRRAGMLNIDSSFGAGAFYPPGASAVYSLDLSAELYGQARGVRWREKTRAFGISGLDQADGDSQRGAVQQDFELALPGSRFEASLRATGIVAAELPSSQSEEHGLAILEVGWRHPASTLRLRAGGGARYYDGSLEIAPSGALELHPVDFLSFVLCGAPFLRMPAQRHLQAHRAEAGLAQLQAEEGYRLRSELRFDPAAWLGASVYFDWRKGHLYFLDASDLELEFADTNLGVLGGDLIWQIRPGGPGIGVRLTGQLAFPLPWTAPPWENSLFKHAGAVWRTDFHKLPVEFIIKALVGDFADDGSQPFFFTDWEIVSGLMTSVEGRWKIGKRGTVHTGLEVFLSPESSYSFLIGYGIGY